MGDLIQMRTGMGGEKNQEKVSQRLEAQEVEKQTFEVAERVPGRGKSTSKDLEVTQA